MKAIKIIRAGENNLKAVTVEIPRNRLTVVTGVSGSGKSSLIYDVLFREAENRYLGTFSTYAHRFLGKMKKPDVERIEGLSPAIAVNQKSVIRNPRSTVGTITGIYDYLRLLFARIGKTEIEAPDFVINKNLLSFNSPVGACMHCNGLGVEDRIDPALIVANENKSLRQGAFVITAPNGYIIYSQVTMDVLADVCRAEGFSVDTPWKDLTPEQQQIVFYGSNKIEVPFGKHTLESRMKWSGITAKPRDTGFYKGVIPVMENILKRDRNKNILRFVRSVPCPECLGKRLNQNALSVKIDGINIHDLSAMPISDLGDALHALSLDKNQLSVAKPVIAEIIKRTELLEKLQAGHLSLMRESTTLSGGESQRLRLATQAISDLKNVIYIFDEPSIGLHPTENFRMIEVLQSLRDQENTVVVVEHDDDFIRHADYVIDIGPAAGKNGGSVLLSCPPNELMNAPPGESATADFISGRRKFRFPDESPQGRDFISIKGASQHNLKIEEARFFLQTMNVVTGVTGAGKSTLVNHTLARFLNNKLHQGHEIPGKTESISGWDKLGKLILIDQSPIGKTPRSNPATYTGLSDHIRDLFAAQPEARKRGWNKSRFSFNVVGGRCENCQGAGYIQVGMHFLGDVEIVCETCAGKRFNDETLQITYRGKNISQVLDLSVAQAVSFFSDAPKAVRIVETMNKLGLGYLKLGQRSTTLSGGEAQRVKLATELARPGAGHTLYIFDEPTTGLHNADVEVLLRSLQNLVENKNTVILIEHHPGVIAAAGNIIDLGPGSGKSGGMVVFQGTPKAMLQSGNSPTALALKSWHSQSNVIEINRPAISEAHHIIFKNVTTHNLKGIDVAFPKNEITVVTGVSGSGKSSLVFDTLYAESRNRFLENFSPYVRAQLGMQSQGAFDEASGITPSIAINRRFGVSGGRSTLGTFTGIYDLYRLLYARTAISSNYYGRPVASLFSFNHQSGACSQCDGLGEITICDPDKLITHPEKSILAGAMDGTKWGKFYGDPFGRYFHSLLAAAKNSGVDFSVPWIELSTETKDLALYGSGDQIFKVTWQFKRGKRKGVHTFEGKWEGLAGLVNEEYARKHADHRGDAMMDIMQKVKCPSCNGKRLNPHALGFKIQNIDIATLAGYSIGRAHRFFMDFDKHEKNINILKITVQLRDEIQKKLEILIRLGLSYPAISRNLATLSGGERQRAALAAQLSNRLTGITLVLDEPTVGLHASDTQNLMNVIKEIRNQGNTVVMVEHDPEVILAAGHVIEIGPGAGESGGSVIATGSPQEIIQNPASGTAPYLIRSKSGQGQKLNPLIHKVKSKPIKITSAYANNLKIQEVEIPTEQFVVVCGVSGSGKSSLVFDVLARSAEFSRPEGCKNISGPELFSKVVEAGQDFSRPGGESNVLTYTGIFDRVRNAFVKTETAKMQQLKSSHFSFNTKGGRCESCRGKGFLKISLDFMPEVEIPCEVCGGKRFAQEVLNCRLHGKSIYDVLQLSVEHGVNFFGWDEKILSALKTLSETGLGYLRLGQPIETLSGGEMQRLRLAKEIMAPGKGKNLYLFDEPTTGLHPKDVEKLLQLFEELVLNGHSVIVVEHNEMVIEKAEHLIKMGPGAGELGGKIEYQINS
jgi:excinuclease ABC subunit A